MTANGNPEKYRSRDAMLWVRPPWPVQKLHVRHQDGYFSGLMGLEVGDRISLQGVYGNEVFIIAANEV